MNIMLKTYRSAVDALGEASDGTKDWRWTVLYGVCVYAVVLVFRLSFAGRWDHPELWVEGERILATHDAYFWLAKAKGLGLLEGYPLSIVTRWLHDLCGVPFGSIGFWAPAVVGAFVSSAAFLWGRFLGGTSAGLMAGLLGSLPSGFFYRSRLGYFDTDMFTLLGPLVIALLLAKWVSYFIRQNWLPHKDEQEEPPVYTVWLAVTFGISTRLCGWWHHDILNIGIVLLFMALGLLCVLGKRGARVRGCYELMIFILAAFPGMMWGKLTLWPISVFIGRFGGMYASEFIGLVSILLAFIFAFFMSREKVVVHRILRNYIFCASCGIVLCLATSIVDRPWIAVVAKLSEYLSQGSDPVVMANSQMSVVFPSILHSIIEAKRVALPVILERMVFWNWLGWLGLATFLILVIMRPVSLLLAPLLILSLSSVFTGVRFTMFGGTALIIGLSVMVSLLLKLAFQRFRRKEAFKCLTQVCLSLIIMSLVWSSYGKIPITPVISKAHAESLVELKRLSTEDSMVWTWWDWGYASQYYSNRKTVIDGGRHSGRNIYPVAFAFSTDSFQQANQMIRFSSQYPLPSDYDFGYSPSTYWIKQEPASVIRGIEEMRHKAISYPVKAPQYIVVSWKDLRLAKWITYFGNWNLQTGSTVEASIGNYDPGKLGINTQRGAVMDRSGGGGLVSDITVLSPEGVEPKEYFMNTMSPRLLPKRRHLLVNSVTKQSILMDRTAKRSTMTRLLTGDPNDPEISKYFKLVVDKLPFVRIYEVVQ